MVLLIDSLECWCLLQNGDAVRLEMELWHMFDEAGQPSQNFSGRLG